MVYLFQNLKFTRESKPTMLTDIFLKLVLKYTAQHELANELWLEIFTKYSEPKRHYHTISHIENLVDDLTKVKDQITDFDTVLFAVFYHDIVYKATSSTNEEDSVSLARKRLNSISFPPECIDKCCEMILATKSHQLSNDGDTNLLTDADLAILGQNSYDYQHYTEQVREEYSIYPDFMYIPGRKKVLHHFLDMEVIYKTEYFYSKYEKQARVNLLSELSDLQD